MLIKGHDYPALTLRKVSFPVHKGPKLQPTGDLVHIQADHLVNKVGLILRAKEVDSEKLEAELAQCRVLAVGPDAHGIEAGDIVLIKQHAYSGEVRFDIFKDGTALYPREAVVAIVERT